MDLMDISMLLGLKQICPVYSLLALVVLLCVYLSVTMLTATHLIYTLKLRYYVVRNGMFKSCGFRWKTLRSSFWCVVC